MSETKNNKVWKIETLENSDLFRASDFVLRIYRFYLFRIFLSAIVIWLFAGTAFAEDAWIPMAIHVSTTVSDGDLSLQEIIETARAEGIKALIITDRDSMKWEYGLWPLRHIFKKTEESNSVFKYGIKKYLQLIELEARKNPDMVIITGLESAPFYYWTGLPFSKNFILHDWHKHLLVIGLKQFQDYKNLPAASNRSSGDPLRLWPFLTLVLGFFCLRRKVYTYEEPKGRPRNIFSKKWRGFGITVMATSILFILDGLAGRPLSYDQYSQNAGVRPYQMFIDDVERRGGMTFWAHPEAVNIEQESGVKIETQEHVIDLWRTSGYTGYAVFYEGYEKIGKAGGDWDYLLKDYCLGRRSKPVWAIAGLAFDHGRKEDLTARIRDVQTYAFAAQASAGPILEAIRQGRVYVSRGVNGNKLSLERFAVRDKVSGKSALTGGGLESASGAVIEIKGRLASLEPGDIEIRLVRGGQIIKTFKESASFDEIYEDGSLALSPGEKTFYRLEIKNGSQLILTNPIFVENTAV